MSDSARPVVLIDARGLRDDATSNHTYWRELTAALVNAEPDYRWVLASNAPFSTDHLPTGNWEKMTAGPANDRVWSFFFLPKVSREVHADVVHVQYTVSPFFGCPVVTTVHDVSFFVNPEWLPARDGQILRITVPKGCRKAKAVVVPSASAKRDLLKFIPVDERKVFVTPLGAPPLDPDAEPVESDYFLLVGGFSPRKNRPLALRAVELAREQSGKNLRLVITGPQKEAGAETYPSWVDLPGPVPREELDRLYRGAIALIHPALYEGFGLTPLEAWSHRTPAIVSSIDPLLESCGPAEECVAGWEAQDWSQALIKLLDPIERQRMSDLAVAQLARYPWSVTAEATLAAYRHALA